MLLLGILFSADFIFFWRNLTSLFADTCTPCPPCSWGGSGPLGKVLAVAGKCLFLVDLMWNFNLSKPAATCCHSDSFELCFLHWVMNSSVHFYVLLDPSQQQSRGKSMFTARQLRPCPDYRQQLSCSLLQEKKGHKKGRPTLQWWSVLFHLICLKPCICKWCWF